MHAKHIIETGLYQATPVFVRRPLPTSPTLPSTCFDQDDIMMATLTVRENLHFSASLRLPSHTTRTQRKERVEKVINELGLTKCADTKV